MTRIFMSEISRTWLWDIAKIMSKYLLLEIYMTLKEHSSKMMMKV